MNKNLTLPYFDVRVHKDASFTPVAGSENISGVSVTMQPESIMVRVYMKENIFKYYSFLHSAKVEIIPILFQV